MNVAAVNPVHCELVQNLDSLSAIREQWDALLAEADGQFYQDWRWLLPLARYLITEPCFLLGWQADRLVLVVPLDYDRRTRMLTLMFCKQTDLTDVLYSPRCNLSHLADTLLQALHLYFPGWTGLQNKRMPEGCHADRLFSALGLYYQRDPIGSNSFFNVDRTDALNSYSKKQIKNVRRQRKVLQHDLQFEFNAGAAHDAEIFFTVEEASWKGHSGRQTSILMHPDLTQFYRQTAENFAANQQLRINQLKTATDIIAVQFSLLCGRRQYLLKIAYHPDYQAHAPGSILLLQLLQERCSDSNIEQVNLVTGPEWAKRWHPLNREMFWGTIYNKSIRGQSALIISRIKDVLRPIKTKLMHSRKAIG